MCKKDGEKPRTGCDDVLSGDQGWLKALLKASRCTYSVRGCAWVAGWTYLLFLQPCWSLVVSRSGSESGVEGVYPAGTGDRKEGVSDNGRVQRSCHLDGPYVDMEEAVGRDGEQGRAIWERGWMGTRWVRWGL